MHVLPGAVVYVCFLCDFAVVVEVDSATAVPGVDGAPTTTGQVCILLAILPAIVWRAWREMTIMVATTSRHIT